MFMTQKSEQLATVTKKTVVKVSNKISTVAALVKSRKDVHDTKVRATGYCHQKNTMKRISGNGIHLQIYVIVLLSSGFTGCKYC